MGAKRILFVDDEQAVLDEIKQTIEGTDEEWEGIYLLNGKDALAAAEEGQPDILVVDAKLPDMAGAELIEAMKKKFPDVICFVLSDYADQETIFKTIAPTDQILTKPCAPELLISSLKNAVESGEFLEKSKILSVVGNVDTLPTLPELYMKIKMVLESESSSSEEVAQIISQDVVISAKILQLVNSAFFGLSHRIENIQRAVVYLGVETIKGIVLVTEVFNQFSEKEMSQFKIQNTYDHSLFVGLMGREVYETIEKDRKIAEQVYMAGLLHDIGKLFLVRSRPEEYLEILKEAETSAEPLYKLEKDKFGVNHADIGSYFMGVWGLSRLVVRAIAFHHRPEAEEPAKFGVTSAVHLGNVLTHRTKDGEQGKKTIEGEYNQEYLEKLKLTEYIEEWEELAKVTLSLSSEDKE